MIPSTIPIDQERDVASTETSKVSATLRYGAPASMEHLEVMVGIFSSGRCLGEWEVGWVEGWVWLGGFTFLLWVFWGVRGKKQIERQSWEVLFKKSEDENGTRQKTEGNLHFCR